MARPRRSQRPNGIYHVSNSSQSHGPLFESQEDVDRHLALLAWQSQERRIQVLCSVEMNTHYHAIVQSLDGRLDDAMQATQQGYAEYFNRTRARKGHAFKSRYFSREVHDQVDLAVTADYIDWNPVAAGIVQSPAEYPHGTARYYCGDPGLPWLARDHLEEVVCRLTRSTRYSPDDYPALWKFANRAGTRDLIARAMAHHRPRVAPLAVLARAGPAHVQEWLAKRMLAEEGRIRPCLVLSGAALLESLRQQGVQEDRWGRTLRAALLQVLSGWTLPEIGKHFGVNTSTAWRWLAAHRDRMTHDAEFAARVAEHVRRAIQETYGRLALEDRGDGPSGCTTTPRVAAEGP